MRRLSLGPWQIFRRTASSSMPRCRLPLYSALPRCSIKPWSSASSVCDGVDCRERSGLPLPAISPLTWSSSHPPRSSSTSNSEGLMSWRTYWLSFVICSVLALSSIAFLTPPPFAAKPPRPDLPDLSRSYPAEYSAAGSDTVHEIFYHDLFGIGSSIRRANLFLIGSSHYEFGFSAEELEHWLSKDGHP